MPAFLIDKALPSTLHLKKGFQLASENEIVNAGKVEPEHKRLSYNTKRCFASYFTKPELPL